jgi:hypothetical protein
MRRNVLSLAIRVQRTLFHTAEAARLRGVLDVEQSALTVQHELPCSTLRTPQLLLVFVRSPVPIAITGVGGTAWGLALVASLVTIMFSVPINERLATWNPAALPPDYQQFLRSWWQWHQVRLVTMFGAMCLVFVAMLRT